jgi:hypothetical protein
MIEVKSALPTAAVEASLRRAVERHHTRLNAVNRPGASHIVTWSVSQPAMESELLEADPRFAVFLPLRIAARPIEEGCLLQTVSPCELAALFQRQDLEKLTRRAERWLRDLMEESSQPVAAARAASAAAFQYSLGAREDQMNMRGTVPPRIDAIGSRVEDIAGTGQQDTQGG